jgi:hypothetical protein
MNSRLEQFVRDHREEFDGEEPDSKVWDKIQRQMETGREGSGGPAAGGPSAGEHGSGRETSDEEGSDLESPGQRKSRVIHVEVRWLRYGAAAALVLLLIGGGWFYMNHSGDKQHPLATNNSSNGGTLTHDSGTSGTVPNSADRLAAGQTIRDSGAPGTNQDTAGSHGQTNTSPQDMVQEEMYHYAKLVELKHRELKTIEKDEPLLYRQFVSDVNKLDSVYLDLQQQLSKNPNREQLLEAMLQNLQLQMGLLNHQLDIIKQINNSKKSAYEKAYKTTI